MIFASCCCVCTIYMDCGDFHFDELQGLHPSASSTETHVIVGLLYVATTPRFGLGINLIIMAYWAALLTYWNLHVLVFLVLGKFRKIYFELFTLSLSFDLQTNLMSWVELFWLQASAAGRVIIAVSGAADELYAIWEKVAETFFAPSFLPSIKLMLL